MGLLWLSLLSQGKIEISTVKILEENLVQSILQQTPRDKFPFKQEYNLKQGEVYSTLDLLTKMTLNVLVTVLSGLVTVLT